MYISVLAAVCVITLISLYVYHIPQSQSLVSSHVTKAVFQVVSIGTTTGFTSENFSAWPAFLPMLLLIIVSFMGGCAGSTGGGMKVIRVLLLFKQGVRELKTISSSECRICSQSRQEAC